MQGVVLNVCNQINRKLDRYKINLFHPCIIFIFEDFWHTVYHSDEGTRVLPAENQYIIIIITVYNNIM